MVRVRWGWWLAVGLGLWLALGWGRGLVAGMLTRVVIANPGRVETATVAPAVISLRERVSVAPVSGVVRLVAEEGQRVRTGAPVVELVNLAVQREVEARLAELDERIAAYRQREARETEAIREQLEAVGERLARALDALRRAAAAGDHRSMAEARDQVEAEARSRQTLVEQLQSLEGGLEALLEARAAAEVKLQGAIYQIPAAGPGHVSYALDGLESRLTPEALRAMDTRALLAVNPGNHRVIAGERVEAGTPLFKLAEGDLAYLGAVVPASEAAAIVDGAAVTVRFPEFRDQELPGRVVQAGVREKTGYQAVVVQVNGFLREFLRVRRTRVELVVTSPDGLVVPRSSLVTRDGQLGLYIVRETIVTFRPVTVLGGNAREAVVEGIAPGTQVVANPWLVREGRPIR